MQIVPDGMQIMPEGIADANYAWRHCRCRMCLTALQMQIVPDGIAEADYA
jgi:hypothetical protein